jgi:hypothetical protein
MCVFENSEQSIFYFRGSALICNRGGRENFILMQSGGHQTKPGELLFSVLRLLNNYGVKSNYSQRASICARAGGWASELPFECLRWVQMNLQSRMPAADRHTRTLDAVPESLPLNSQFVTQGNFLKHGKKIRQIIAGSKKIMNRAIGKISFFVSFDICGIFFMQTISQWTMLYFQLQWFNDLEFEIARL